MARTAPRLTRSPASAPVRSIGPGTSARTVAACTGSSEPEMVGPVRSSVSATTTVFSAPTVTTGSAAGVALAFSSLRQPLTTTSPTAATTSPRIIVLALPLRS